MPDKTKYSKKEIKDVNKIFEEPKLMDDIFENNMLRIFKRIINGELSEQKIADIREILGEELYGELITKARKK